MKEVRRGKEDKGGDLRKALADKGTPVTDFTTRLCG